MNGAQLVAGKVDTFWIGIIFLYYSFSKLGDEGKTITY